MKAFEEINYFLDAVNIPGCVNRKNSVTFAHRVQTKIILKSLFAQALGFRAILPRYRVTNFRESNLQFLMLIAHFGIGLYSTILTKEVMRSNSN